MKHALRTLIQAERQLRAKYRAGGMSLADMQRRTDLQGAIYTIRHADRLTLPQANHAEIFNYRRALDARTVRVNNLPTW